MNFTILYSNGLLIACYDHNGIKTNWTIKANLDYLDCDDIKNFIQAVKNKKNHCLYMDSLGECILSVNHNEITVMMCTLNQLTIMIDITFSVDQYGEQFITALQKFIQMMSNEKSKKEN